MKHQAEYLVYAAFYAGQPTGAAIDTDLRAYAMMLGTNHAKHDTLALTPEQFETLAESIALPADATAESILQLTIQAAGARGDTKLADECSAILSKIYGPDLYVGYIDKSVIVYYYVKPRFGVEGGFIATTIHNVMRIERPRIMP